MNIAWQDDETNDVQYWKQRAIDEYERCNRYVEKCRKLDDDLDRHKHKVEQQVKESSASLIEKVLADEEAKRLHLVGLLNRLAKKHVTLEKEHKRLQQKAKSKPRRESVLTVPTHLL